MTGTGGPDEVLRTVVERWALRIVREVSLGCRRFDDLQSATGAPRAVLSDRLRRLVAAGVLSTRSYRAPGSRARSEYVLTEAGIDLLPLQAALAQWTERHLPGDRPGTGDPVAAADPASGNSPAALTGAALDYRHVACGGRVTARLVCDCGRHVSPHAGVVAQINT